MAGPDRPRARGLVDSGLRFVLAGGLNTLVTGLALTALSLVVDPRLAYTLVFLAGIALSAMLARSFVYGVRMGRAAMTAYVVMYLVVFAIGLAAVASARDAGLPEAWTGLVVLVTAPLTFLGGRLIALRDDRRTTAGEPAERTDR